MRVVILGSGRGSNAEAILQAEKDGRLGQAHVVALFSDRADAGLLALGPRFGVPAHFIDPAPFKTKLEGEGEARAIAALSATRPDLIVLAGFMRVLKPGLAFRRLFDEIGTGRCRWRRRACGEIWHAFDQEGREALGSEAPPSRWSISRRSRARTPRAKSPRSASRPGSPARRSRPSRTVAAVCVYPSMVRHARRALGPTSTVKIASVATAFPSGQAPLRTRLAEVTAAVADGADEIDMVINRGAFLAGEFGRVQDEIARSSRPADQGALKVIFETSELETYDNIRAASFLAMRRAPPGRFHQDEHGQDLLQCDARQQPGDDRCDP
jgi:hypothetical protein